MYFCYIDDAGCTGALPSNTSEIQPIFLLAGLFVHESKVVGLTRDFMAAKRRFFPGLLPGTPTFMDWITVEVKGSDLRTSIATGTLRQRKAAIGYLDKVRDLCVAADGHLVGRVWVKEIGGPMNGTSVYTYSVQYILKQFQHFLAERGAKGIVIADSRNKGKNTSVSHSIFTQKYRAQGDLYPNILEMPLFGHSDNHAGVQISDTLCSAMIVPMCIETYCVGTLASVHIRTGYDRIKERYVDDVKALQYRYRDATGKRHGGIVVSDGLTKRPGFLLFMKSAPATTLAIEVDAPDARAPSIASLASRTLFVG